MATSYYWQVYDTSNSSLKISNLTTRIPLNLEINTTLVSITFSGNVYQFTFVAPLLSSEYNALNNIVQINLFGSTISQVYPFVRVVSSSNGQTPGIYADYLNGYQQGDVVNTGNNGGGMVYTCLSNVAGAASWVFLNTTGFTGNTGITPAQYTDCQVYYPGAGYTATVAWYNGQVPFAAAPLGLGATGLTGGMTSLAGQWVTGGGNTSVYVYYNISSAQVATQFGASFPSTIQFVPMAIVTFSQSTGQLLSISDQRIFANRAFPEYDPSSGATSMAVAATGSIGTSQWPAREDHVHPGVHQLSVQGLTNPSAYLGNVQLVPLANVGLTGDTNNNIYVSSSCYSSTYGFTGIGMSGTQSNNTTTYVGITGCSYTVPQTGTYMILFESFFSAIATAGVFIELTVGGSVKVNREYKNIQSSYVINYVAANVSASSVIQFLFASPTSGQSCAIAGYSMIVTRIA